jgi:hypothetical protein
MALPVSLQWDIRTTGSDSNGGAFDPAQRSVSEGRNLVNLHLLKQKNAALTNPPIGNGEGSIFLFKNEFVSF